MERRRPLALALGLSLEIDAIGIVDDAVEYGIRDHFLADHLRPALQRDLSCAHYALASVTLLDIHSIRDTNLCDASVVNHCSDIGLGITWLHLQPWDVSQSVLEGTLRPAGRDGFPKASQ